MTRYLMRSAALSLTVFLLLSCGSSRESVPLEQYSETENTLQKRERELQEKTIEMLDLKNQIIILQSEVADLKDDLMLYKDKNDSLSLTLSSERQDARIMAERLDEADMQKERLLEDNSLLTQKVIANTDSLQTVLEIAARKNYEGNILNILSSDEDSAEDSRPLTELPLQDSAPAPGEAEGKTSPESTPVSEKKTSSEAPAQKTPSPTAPAAAKEAVSLQEKMDSAISPVMKLTNEEYQQRYQEVLKFYFNGAYDEAIREFKALLAVDNSNEYSDNCQYWIAESYYSQGKFEDAVREFKKVLSYSESNKADHALFKSGLSQLKLNRKKESLQSFQTLIERYPDSELVTKVKDILASGSF